MDSRRKAKSKRKRFERVGTVLRTDLRGRIDLARRIESQGGAGDKGTLSPTISSRLPLSQCLAAGEGAGEGGGVDVLKGGADGEAEGQAADRDGEVGELLFEVKGGGVSFESRVEREDELFDVVVLDAGGDPVDADRSGGAAVKRGEEVLYNVIESAE